ncbi:MaoC/PaaZ C-terminal domain-containing protein [Cupriavidus taiwanensis]|uniref:MaoC/PaaZ C-terminal domain-containing protein n=1 Tax=Cupriavidus taiwanensis TaxID=164546 RepID=UPI000E1A8BB8|nr:MaoC/PaaZ C-terminal domain-containing protein [Cupriavidus taiwanensis]SOY73329.1 MaoC like domain protein 17 [Cupriavidus taiwanensis]
MAIDYHRLKSAAFAPLRHAYGPDDCILYALGVGAGLSDDPAIGNEVEYLYEERLKMLPSMVAVLAYPGFWMRDAVHGIDWRRVVNGEMRMTLLRRLATSGEVVSRSRVTRITDKGARGGALVVTERSLFDAQTGQPVARVDQVNVCRGDGGYSAGDASKSDDALPPIPRPPERKPDDRLVLPVSRNQAAIYRLTGDRNPLHIDPDSAKLAGLDAPILHGASMAGVAARAVMTTPPCADAFVCRLDIRFSGMAYPGRAVAVELWRSPQATCFRCSEADSGRELAFGVAAWKSSGSVEQ